MKFTDSENREWPITLNALTVMRLKGEGTNILELEANFGEKLKAMLKDAYGIFDILEWVWRIVKTDADQRGVTHDAFMASLNGEAMAAARHAFLEAYANFTQAEPIRWHLRKQLGLEKDLEAKATRAVGIMMKGAEEEYTNLVSQFSDENILRKLESDRQKIRDKVTEMAKDFQPPTSNEPSSVSLAS